MLLFLFTIACFLTMFFLGKKVIFLAKRNLLKDHAAWSGKDIKIKHTKNSNDSSIKPNDNYLKIIADESKMYLEKQSKTGLD